MKTESRINIYEVDGKEVPTGENVLPLIIRNHWNRQAFVVLSDGTFTYTVDASDLRRAIDAAQMAKR